MLKKQKEESSDCGFWKSQREKEEQARLEMEIQKEMLRKKKLAEERADACSRKGTYAKAA